MLKLAANSDGFDETAMRMEPQPWLPFTPTEAIA